MRWVRYEVLKSQWLRLHPNATPAEYEQAMRVIARMCRV